VKCNNTHNQPAGEQSRDEIPFPYRITLGWKHAGIEDSIADQSYQVSSLASGDGEPRWLAGSTRTGKQCTIRPLLLTGIPLLLVVLPTMAC